MGAEEQLQEASRGMSGRHHSAEETANLDRLPLASSVDALYGSRTVAITLQLELVCEHATT